jgi:FG-GAP-like repeat
MYIRENAFLYDADNAIRLRGTPQIGMYVGANVFRHDSPDGAMSQTETGLYIEYANGVDTNRYGIDGSTQLGSCDFDGDGINDAFMATGVTLWYSSGGTMPWAYLNASTARLADVTLADFDGDGRCDVLVGGLLSSGGTGPFRPWFRAPLPSPVLLP